MHRWLPVIFWTAVAVSVVHYADNYFNFADYPHGDGPEPSKTVIGIAWFVFTAFGLAGYFLIRRGRIRAGAFCLLAYSGSGLVGIGHYTVNGMTSEPAWRQAHVVADIVLGVALMTLALAALVAGARKRSAA